MAGKSTDLEACESLKTRTHGNVEINRHSLILHYYMSFTFIFNSIQ